MKARTRGFVLAAGCGTRLRPLTLFLPKPLLPVCGEPVLGSTLRQLGEAGCEAAVVNLHHLGESISAHLGKSYYGLPLVYSPEEEIQGTLGALYPQRDFLAVADLVLLTNGDTLVRRPWRRLIRRHLRSGADATLLVHRRAPSAELGGGVGLDPSGRVVSLREESFGVVRRHHVFAGTHVLSRRLLDRLTAGPGDIISDLYVPLLRDGGHLEAVVTGGDLYDLGTADRYLEAVLSRTRGRFPFRRHRNWISPLAEVHPRATVVDSVVEAGARVGEEAHVSSSLLLADTEVAAGSRIERTILGPGASLPASAKIEGRMINRGHVGHPTGPHESVMGELIYTPLASPA